MSVTVRCVLSSSHPSRVRGLKYFYLLKRHVAIVVAPLAGAWIEMLRKSSKPSSTSLSHPSRVRGLKCSTRSTDLRCNSVAPLAGAWIEIKCPSSPKKAALVAPLAGAWIEIRRRRHRGIFSSVAPLAGAWIEMTSGSAPARSPRRTPRGCVD